MLLSGGNQKTLTDTTKIKKSFENNQRINHSMTVNSLSKIFNNIATDVIQKNSVAASSAVGASNSIFISGIKCETVKISGNKQKSVATLQMEVQTKQKNTNKISNDITTTINKTIEKVGTVDLAKLQSDNTNQLNEFMKATPGYDPDKAHKLGSSCPSNTGGLFSVGNKCDVNSKYELDASIKQSLDLDESFKITDNDDITNEIKNKVEQSNFAACQSNASAQNQIVIQDIMCAVNEASNRKGSFEFEDNEQEAIANLYMKCVFDQESVNEISNKILNNIAKKYNQIYDAVAEKAKTKGPAYYEKASKLVDLLSASGIEHIQAAAGDLPLSDKVNIPQSTLASQPLSPQPLAPRPLVPQPLVPQPLAPQLLTPQPLAPQPLAPQLLTPQLLTPQLLTQQPAQIVSQLIDIINKNSWIWIIVIIVIFIFILFIYIRYQRDEDDD
jgi:hypothetical protein